MNKGFSPRFKWSEADLQRLATAWNSGIALRDLASRFGVSAATIIAKLAAARGAGLKIIERKSRSFYG